jgi:hypothetical protein
VLLCLIYSVSARERFFIHKRLYSLLSNAISLFRFIINVILLLKSLIDQKSINNLTVILKATSHL